MLASPSVIGSCPNMFILAQAHYSSLANTPIYIYIHFHNIRILSFVFPVGSPTPHIVFLFTEIPDFFFCFFLCVTYNCRKSERRLYVGLPSAVQSNTVGSCGYIQGTI